MLLDDYSSDGYFCKQCSVGTWETAVARYAAQMAGQRQDEDVLRSTVLHDVRAGMQHTPVRSCRLVEVGLWLGSRRVVSFHAQCSCAHGAC